MHPLQLGQAAGCGPSETPDQLCRPRCRNCSGTVSAIADTRAYLRAPGTVVRCRNCSSPLIVISSLRGRYRVDLSGLADLRR